MKLFDPQHREVTPAQAGRYARFEMAHTVADFGAAALFVVGSILFFFKPAEMAAIICFLLGSILFTAKPSIRLAREIWLAKNNETKRLAQLAPEGPGNIRKTPRAEDSPSIYETHRTNDSMARRQGRDPH